MDFSLLAQNKDFDFTRYFQPIIDQFTMMNRTVVITKKTRRISERWSQHFLRIILMSMTLPFILSNQSR